MQKISLLLQKVDFLMEKSILNDNPNFNVVAIFSFKEKLTKLYERKYEGCRIQAKIQKIENETLRTKLSIKKKKNKEKRIL